MQMENSLMVYGRKTSTVCVQFVFSSSSCVQFVFSLCSVRIPFVFSSCSISWPWSERLELGGPCWLLKLRWMGTQRGQMKGVHSWLVYWACRADTKDFCSALAALVGPSKIFFSSPYTIYIPLSSSPSILGRQPCWVTCLLDLDPLPGITFSNSDLRLPKVKRLHGHECMFLTHYHWIYCTYPKRHENTLGI